MIALSGADAAEYCGKFAAPDVVLLAGANPSAKTPPLSPKVVQIGVFPGSVCGVAEMFFVPTSVPAPPGPAAPVDEHAPATALLTNEAGPVIEGVFNSVAARPFFWLRNVTTVLRPGVPLMFAVPTANCSVEFAATSMGVKGGWSEELPEPHPARIPPRLIVASPMLSFCKTIP